MKPAPFRAVLFDFDGVIADTMPANLAAWQKAFDKYGVSFDPDDYYQLEGKGPRQIAADLCRKTGLDESLAGQIAAEKDSLISHENGLPVYPEIPRLLQLLVGKGIVCGLVTGASRFRIEATLPVEIRTIFSAITTSDDVQKTKPDPEPYLATARKLGLTQRDCVVVENAPLGIESAISGGFHCIAITTTLSAENLQRASEVLPDHAALCLRLLGDQNYG